MTGIDFIASIEKVQTLADGGIRVTLDLPEDAIAEAAMLMQIRQAGVALSVHAVAEAKNEEGFGASITSL